MRGEVGEVEGAFIHEEEFEVSRIFRNVLIRCPCSCQCQAEMFPLVRALYPGRRERSDIAESMDASDQLSELSGWIREREREATEEDETKEEAEEGLEALRLRLRRASGGESGMASGGTEPRIMEGKSSTMDLRPPTRRTTLLKPCW